MRADSAAFALHKTMIFSGCVSLSSHLNCCHASVTKRNSVCRLDQVPCDSNCWAGRHLSGSDNRVRNVRLALRSVNGLAVRFAAICSAFKSNAGPVPDRNSHNRACTKSNTRSYPDNGAVAKSSPYASASSDSSPPPPIAFDFCDRTCLQYAAGSAATACHV